MDLNLPISGKPAELRFQLVCPLCGRFVSLAHFNPSGFDSDIYAVEVAGLGRGRGVKVTARHSILRPGDPTVELIKDRLLELCKVLLDKGILRPHEALLNLKIKTVSPKEFSKLRGDVKLLTVKLEDAERAKRRLMLEAEALEASLLGQAWLCEGFKRRRSVEGEA